MMCVRAFLRCGPVACCLSLLAACGFPKPPDVAACSQASDCASSAPFCVSGECVAGCQSNDDCTSAGSPLCDTSSGMCVACLDATSCSADRPFCDSAANVCRGCERDSECGSGVCLVADGTCADSSAVLHVAGASASDTGDCPSESPCATLQYAISRATQTRNVVLVHAGALFPTAITTIDRAVYIAGNGATIAWQGDLFAVAQFTTATLDNMTLQPGGSQNPKIATVASSSSLRLSRITGSQGGVTTTGGTIAAINSSFSSAFIGCMNGAISVTASTFKDSTVGGTNCQVSVRQSRFEETADGSVSIEGGVAQIENNVIVNAYELADSMHVVAVAPGSYVWFNTFVNSSGVASDGVAPYCDNTPAVTSNIFAYGSMHPNNVSPQCMARYSLYDTVALPEQTAGTENKVADSSTFFVDKGAKDFHLSTASPAKGGGEPGLGVAQDLAGTPRPSQPGSRPDIGAYQAQ